MPNFLAIPCAKSYIPTMESVANTKFTPDQLDTMHSNARIVGVALDGFFNIADEWKLSIAEQQAILGSIAQSTLFKWKKAPPAVVTKDILERISYVFGIYKALRIIYTEDEHAHAWLNRPNEHIVFNGKTPRARMTAGNVSDLYEVRKFTDGRRAPW